MAETEGQEVKAFCHYHPSAEAHSICRQCAYRFCSACVEPQETGDRCSRCGHVLSHVESLSEVEPFWQRLGLFFLRPWQRRSTWAFMLVAGLSGLGLGWLGLPWVAVGVALLIALPGITSILWHVSRGRVNHDRFGDLFDSARMRLMIRLLVLLAPLFILTAACVIWLDSSLALGLVPLLLLPALASLLVLTQKDSLDLAIGPGAIAHTISALGTVYWLLWWYLTVWVWGFWVIGSLVLIVAPAWFAGSLAAFFTAYGLLVGAHLIGYVALQYRAQILEQLTSDSLPHSERRVGETPSLAASGVSKGLMIRLDMALKEGNLESAESILKKVLQKNAKDRNALNRLFLVAKEKQNLAQLDRFRVQIVEMLLADVSRKTELVEYLRERLLASEEFEIRESELLYRSARSLYFQGEYRLVLKLLHDLEKRMPGLPRTVECLMLTATTLANGLQKPDKARAYLKHIQKQYAHHRLVQEIPERLKVLQESGVLPSPSADFGFPDASGVGG